MSTLEEAEQRMDAAVAIVLGISRETIEMTAGAVDVDEGEAGSRVSGRESSIPCRRAVADRIDV